jgi:predicted GIY-YIG superfamily endonuclease
MNDNSYYVYIIKGIQNNKIKFYIGCTNNLTRRLKQHNRELVGGAKSTINFSWKYIAILSNIPNNITALQLEWKLKNTSKKTNIILRINAFLEYLEKHNKPSTNAQVLDYKILFSLHDELYNKIDKKEGWKNVIIINVNENDLQGNPGCSF